MDQLGNDSDDGTANTGQSGVASTAKTSSGDAKLASPDEVGGATGQDVAAAISDKITYSVIIEEAQERFAHLHRKVPSVRSLQRYCDEGLIVAIRTPVIYEDGSHGNPWFLNAESLEAYIKRQP